MPVRLPPLTESASRLLLEGLIDYAGLYPPAALAMPQAVRNYAHYRASGHGWMLGRFVCSASALAIFSEKADPLLPRDAGAIPWRLSVTSGGEVAEDLAQIAAFNERHRVCFDECGAVADTYEARATSPADVARIDASTPRELTTYIEVPLGDAMDACIDAIAAAGRRAKVRTGGIIPDAFPASAQVVRFFEACRRTGVVAKATAGLHHPVTGLYRLTYEPDATTGRMFGFLTVLLAAAHLEQGGSAAEAIALLEETRGAAFAWSDTAITWHGATGTITFSRELLQDVRARRLISIGSCSFTEPLHESQALGWV